MLSLDYSMDKNRNIRKSTSYQHDEGSKRRKKNMKYIIFTFIAFILYNFFNILRRSVGGTKYWKEAEHTFMALCEKGYDKSTALLEISKQRHPELSESTHKKIVEKFSDVNRLANFIYNALDFKPSHNLTYGKKLTDEQALALLESTTVSSNGLVNTDFAAARKIVEP